MERYEMGKLLGQGNFAKVYHARDIKTGSSVAIKIIDKAKILKVGMMEHVEAEISIMKLVRHPNVVQLFEVMATKSKIYLVMEYVRGGELFDEVAKGKMKEEAARKYFQQLISAVDFCHSRGVYHRDLKPENLLIDENGELKISDFGLSVLVGSEQRERLLHTMCGTPAYVAPEVIRGRWYEGSMADIWSCGVILFVLLSGRHPFHDANIMEMYRKIGMAEFKYPNRFPSSARRLISKILDPNPNTRIPTSKIVESSWFRRGLKSKVSRSASPEVVLDTDVKPSNLNAFEIISLSAGFDLSGLFEGSDERKETKFMSTKPAKTIISKIEEIAGRLKMKAWKKDGGHLKFEGSKEGRKGVVGIDVEIFEVSNNFHVVEMKKSNGDTLEYGRLMKEEVRPCLKDIVWTWQSEEAPPLEQQE